VSEARRLFLVRHGQTALNAQGRLRGLADPPLDRVGVWEALAVGSALAPAHPVVVLTSPLQRAVATGRAIAAAAAVSCFVDQRFTDRDYGPWTGALLQEVVTQFGSVDAAPGVEPVAAVLARSRPALNAGLDDYPGTVVIVTHDVVIRALLSGIDPELAPLQEPNGCWNELTRDDDGSWRVQSVDQLPH
jgi:probable phosphoglycerate mutase